MRCKLRDAKSPCAMVILTTSLQQKCQGIKVNSVWAEAMQTGAANLLNVHCSTMRYTTLRDVHLFVAHIQGMTTPWEVASDRNVAILLTQTWACIFAGYLLETRHSRRAQLFQIFLQSVPASLCSLSSVLGGLLPFQRVLTVLASQGSYSENPSSFSLLGAKSLENAKTSTEHQWLTFSQSFAYFRHKLDFAPKFGFFQEFSHKTLDFC